MLKLGVTKLGQSSAHALREEAENRGWWPFSYLMLRDVNATYTDEDERLLTRLYRSMAAGNRIHKITRRGRFKDIDERLMACCQERFSRISPIVIHDMAASNGITSLDLFKRISAERDVKVHVTDYYDRLFIVHPSWSHWSVVYDRGKTPLQFVNDRFVLSGYRRELSRYPVNCLLQWWFRRWRLSVFDRILQDFLETPLEQIRESSAVEIVKLFHPLCLREERKQSAFSLGHHNIFEPNPVSAHVVRAMNVITHHHLSSAQLAPAIRNCFENLMPGGLVILGRSFDEIDSSNHATAYEVNLGRIQEAWRIGNGYEHDDLVMDIQL